MKFFASIVLLATAIGIAAFSEAPVISQSPTESVAYPEGYRAWAHVRSAIITPQSPAHKRFGGIHHIYANDKAMEGYTKGEFPDGAIFIFDLLETQESQGVISEGQRQALDVMQKDSKRFAATGGWGFEEFKGDSKTERTVGALATSECFQCHEKKQKQGFVFSEYRK